MGAEIVQRLSTLRHLWIVASLAQDRLEGAKAAVSESQHQERDSKAPITHLSINLGSITA